MEIKIGKSAHACRQCGREFQHEEELRSLIRIVDRDFVREDLCLDCWSEQSAPGAYSVWSPRYYDPKVAEAQPPEVFSPLRQVFYEAVESKDRIEVAVAFLAAQLLRRQKVFRLIKASDDPDTESQVSLFTDRLGDRLIEVHDPNLAYAELEEGRRVLMERLAALESPEDEVDEVEVVEDEVIEGEVVEDEADEDEADEDEAAEDQEEGDEIDGDESEE